MKITKYEIVSFILLYFLILFFLIFNTPKEGISIINLILFPFMLVIPIVLFYYIIRSLLSSRKKNS